MIPSKRDTASKRAATLVVKEYFFILVTYVPRMQILPCESSQGKNICLSLMHGHALIAMLSELGGLAGKVLLDHKRNLEGYGVLEFTKVKSCELSDLLKTVDQSVTVNEELS